MLSALDKWALQYHNGKSTQQDQDEIFYNNSVNETGHVVSTDSPTYSNSESLGTLSEFSKFEEIRGVLDYLLEVHGEVPTKKKEEASRLIYENGNGFNSRTSETDKLDKLNQLIDGLEPDMVAFNEHKLNLQHKDNMNGFSQMFNGEECEIRPIVVNNFHEMWEEHRREIQAWMMFGPMIKQYDFEHLGNDDMGLRIWTYTMFSGSEGHTKRTVYRCNPCYDKTQGINTVYQQQHRFFKTKQKDLTCPRTQFYDDLLVFE